MIFICVGPLDLLQICVLGVMYKLYLRSLVLIAVPEMCHLFHKAVDIFKHYKRKEVFYLTTHSTHFIYGYMASDIW